MEEKDMNTLACKGQVLWQTEECLPHQKEHHSVYYVLQYTVILCITDPGALTNHVTSLGSYLISPCLSFLSHKRWIITDPIL